VLFTSSLVGFNGIVKTQRDNGVTVAQGRSRSPSSENQRVEQKILGGIGFVDQRFKVKFYSPDSATTGATMRGLNKVGW